MYAKRRYNMKEKAKINTKRIGMAVGILLIGLSLFAVQIQAQVEKTVPIDKSAAANGLSTSGVIKDVKPIQNLIDKDKIKRSPPKIVSIPKAKISKEEQNLNDQLTKAREAGNNDMVKIINDKIATLHGRSLSYINAKPYVENSTGNALLPKIAPLWSQNSPPCITCLDSIQSTGQPSIAHDKNGYLYTAVWDGLVTKIFRSNTNGGNKGTTWYLYKTINYATNPSLAAGGDYLFVAGTINDPDGAGAYVWRINLNDGSMTQTYIGGYQYPAHKVPVIVTDYPEWPNNWWVYLAYPDSCGWSGNLYECNSVSFSRSTNQGDSWETPWTASAGWNINPTSIDAGGNTLYIAMTDGLNPRRVFVTNSGNYGNSWTNKTVITGWNDSYDPKVAAVKSNDRSNGNVVVTYTQRANSGDLDVWYAYSNNKGSDWSTNHCLACGSYKEQTSAITASASMISAALAIEFSPSLSYIVHASTTYDKPGSLAVDRWISPNNNYAKLPAITTSGYVYPVGYPVGDDAAIVYNMNVDSWFNAPWIQ